MRPPASAGEPEPAARAVPRGHLAVPAAPPPGSAPSPSGSAGGTRSPAGGAARSGGWPSMAVSRSARVAEAAESTRAAPRVYGCAGGLKICRTGPASTMRPAYITATWSHIFATMPRLWVMKIRARSCARCRSRRRFRYWAWMVRSRLVVGSSAMSSAGSHEMAMAPTMRWRMPPDIWCGYSRTRVSGAEMRTAREQVRAPAPTPPAAAMRLVHAHAAPRPGRRS